MTITSFFDSQKVAGLLRVTEYRHQWLKARFVEDPSVSLELSFEDAEGHVRSLPGTRITYLAIWRGKRTICEYQNGVLCKIPSEDEFALYLSPLIIRLGTYRPMFVQM